MFIGVQFASRTLGALFGENLKRLDLCVTDSFDGYIVDHIAIDEITSFGQGSSFLAQFPLGGEGTASVPAHAVAFNQEITVFLVQISDLLPNGPNPTPNTVPLPLTITFDMRFDVSNGGTALTLSYQSVSSTIADPRIALLNSILSSKLPPQTEALDVVSLVGALNVSGSPAEAGVAVSSDGSLVEFRLELTSVAASDSLIAWEDFFTNGPSDFTRGDDWAVWISVDGVETSMSNAFSSGLSGSTSFRLDSGINVAWQPGEPPSLIVTFNGDAINACYCFWSHIDVNVDVTVTITFSIDTGQIRYDIHIDHSSNDLQVFCCEISAALFFPFIGALLLGDKKIDVGEYILGLLADPLINFIAAIVAAGSQSAPIPTSSLQGTCSKDSDTDVHCLVPFPDGVTPPSPCVPPSIEDRIPTHIYGTPQDAIFPGRLIITGTDSITEAPSAILDCTVSDFVWKAPTPNCSGSIGAYTMSAEVTLTHSGNLSLAGNLMLWFCGAQAYGSTAAQYSPYITETYSYCPYVVTIHIDIPVGVQPTGPCELLIQTSGGARLVTLNPVPPLTQAQVQEFDTLAEVWRLEHCYTLLDPWYKYFHRFNPQWLIDPAYDSIDPERQTQVWEFVVAGALPGDSIGLFGPGQEQLATAQVDAGGVARIGAAIVLQSPVGSTGLRQSEQESDASSSSSRDGRDISIQRLRTGAHTETGAAVSIRMFIKQILVIEQCQLMADRTPMSVMFEAKGRLPALVIAFADGISTFDVSNAAVPRLIAQSIGKIQGAKRTTGGRILTWDGGGISEWKAHRNRRVAEIEGVLEILQPQSGPVLIRTASEILAFDEAWRLMDRAAVSQADHALVLAASAPAAPPASALGITAHVRNGLVARIDSGHVSLGIIAATRKLY